MFGKKKSVTGKDKITKTVESINTLITDLDEGILQVKDEKTAKELALKEQQTAWELAQAKMKNEIDSLGIAAETGSKLKANIANLLK